jgi:hypothetical protein
MLFASTSQFSIGAAPWAVSAASRSENLVGVGPLPSQRVQAPGYFNRDAAWTRGLSEDRYCLDKISDCLSRFGISRKRRLELDDKVTGDTRPAAIIEARSHDDLTNTRDRPCFKRGIRGSVQAQTIDNRKASNATQTSGKPASFCS